MMRAAAVALALSIAAPDAALAAAMTINDTKVHTSRPTKLDITGGIGFFGLFMVGVNGWYSLPLMPDGFIPALNDSFHLEAGVAIKQAWDEIAGVCDYSYTGLAGLAGVRWDFYLTKDWTVFAKAKLGFGYDFADVTCQSGINTASVGGAHVAGDYGVGAYWNFSEDMAVRLEFGYPAINAGISINM